MNKTDPACPTGEYQVLDRQLLNLFDEFSRNSISKDELDRKVATYTSKSPVLVDSEIHKFSLKTVIECVSQHPKELPLKKDMQVLLTIGSSPIVPPSTVPVDSKQLQQIVFSSNSKLPQIPMRAASCVVEGDCFRGDVMISTVDFQRCSDDVFKLLVIETAVCIFEMKFSMTLSKDYSFPSLFEFQSALPPKTRHVSSDSEYLELPSRKYAVKVAEFVKDFNIKENSQRYTIQIDVSESPKALKLFVDPKYLYLKSDNSKNTFRLFLFHDVNPCGAKCTEEKACLTVFLEKQK